MLNKLIEVYRPAWILGALTLVFWAVWEAVAGGLPEIYEIKITSSWVIEYNHTPSRYWDAAFVLACAAGIITLIRLFKILGAEKIFLWEFYFFCSASLACGVLIAIPLLFAPSQSIASVTPFLIPLAIILWLMPLFKYSRNWIEKIANSIVVCLNTTLILAILFTWVRGVWIGLAVLMIGGIILTMPYYIAYGVLLYKLKKDA